ncbi:hypothetical protein Hypma_011955 [Hypsizygus marmoreus]|uniref:Uncharacterized protein n=1 Tax=Hypsizygus marmoreus TaxID=39966 RepID=A0A369JMM3_HYPMA|nr:hypothetical protein Hypma_011955 [Hypsizygus marmoreus]
MAPLDAFTPHLKKVPSTEEESMVNAVVSLVGLSYSADFLETHQDLVQSLANVWPAIFKWLVLLNDEGFPSASGIECPGCAEWSVELAARLWLWDKFDTPHTAPIPEYIGGTAALVACFEVAKSPRALAQRITKMKDVDHVKLVTLALNRVSSAATVWYDDETGCEATEYLLDVINQLTSIPEMWAAFLNAQSVLSLTLALRSLCTY